MRKSIKTIWERLLGRLIRAFYYLPRKFQFRCYYVNDVIIHPLQITPQFIEFEPNVTIGHHARIQGISRYNEKLFEPVIHFGESCSVQQNLHLTCANRIVIGRNTAIAANVTITDIHHPYDDVNKPIERQDIVVSEVVIGEDCKIYNGAVILPGVHIGKHVTVGANSVVTHDIPDYCVAAGVPAKIIKRFDEDNKCWITIK